MNLVMMKKKEKCLVTFNQIGFSLIEILMAILIISILVASVTPLIVASFNALGWAGKKSGELLDAQKKVELVAATREGMLVRNPDGTYSLVPLEEGTFPVHFPGGQESDVSGGVVSAGELQTFLALAPAIRLNPDALSEGYPPEAATVQVVGKNTHFSGHTSLVIKDKNGWTILGCSLSLTDPEHAAITLPAGPGLTNADGPYSVTVTTGSETARAMLQVALPVFVAVGKAKTGKETILVSSALQSGSEAAYWESREPGISSNCYGITFCGERTGGGLFVVVGDNGTILTLADGAGWMPQNSGLHRNAVLRGVAWGRPAENLLFVAVGEKGTDDKGTILTSSDGENWTPLNNENRLNGVTWGGNKFVAVGDKGTILTWTGEDGESWESQDPGLEPNQKNIALHGIAWSAGLNLFVAVGDKGTILTSTDGENWQSRTSGTTADLHGIVIR
ncbi:MAG: prepilin-type N-terminal cleavage/methylation domain-containing protein [Bacillota bacterium]